MAGMGSASQSVLGKSAELKLASTLSVFAGVRVSF
jgi:hypothetical protein